MSVVRIGRLGRFERIEPGDRAAVVAAVARVDAGSVRDWAAANNIPCNRQGPIPRRLIAAYRASRGRNIP